MGLDEIKAALCEGEYSSFSIQWNDGNAPNYETVKQLIEGDGHDYYDKESFVSEEEYQKAIDNNSMWTAHWYPHTPVGFCKIHASTFEALKQALVEEINTKA